MTDQQGRRPKRRINAGVTDWLIITKQAPTPEPAAFVPRRPSVRSQRCKSRWPGMEGSSVDSERTVPKLSAQRLPASRIPSP